MQPVVSMQRPVDTGGEPGTARFTLARVEAGEMPEGRIQMLVHHTEDMVWQPRWLDHPNGAIGLMGLTIAVADLDEAAARFARFTGRAADVSPFGRTIRLDRGRLDLVTADAFAALLPECTIPSLPFAGLCEIKVRSLATLEALLGNTRPAGAPVGRHPDRAVSRGTGHRRLAIRRISHSLPKFSPAPAAAGRYTFSIGWSMRA